MGKFVAHTHIKTYQKKKSPGWGQIYNILMISITGQAQTYLLFFMPCVSFFPYMGNFHPFPEIWLFAQIIYHNPQ